MGEGVIAGLLSMTSVGASISITWTAPLSMTKLREIIRLASGNKEDVQLASFPGSVY